MADNASDRVDVYTRATNKIIQAIEAGADQRAMPRHVPDTIGSSA